MTYYEQLLSQNWLDKRNEILVRDNYQCQSCFNKRLLEEFRVSLSAIGFFPSGRIVYIVYDKNLNNKYRCTTDYYKATFKDILNSSSNRSIIALTSGKGDFITLISTVLLNHKIDFTNDTDTMKQQKQESCLRGMSASELKSLTWIDTKALHVHHKYYQQGKQAWEYPNDALITLCWNCHKELHENIEIDILDETGRLVGKMEVCPKCHGAGHLPKFNHVENGICFECRGTRFS